MHCIHLLYEELNFLQTTRICHKTFQNFSEDISFLYYFEEVIDVTPSFSVIPQLMHLEVASKDLNWKIFETNLCVFSDKNFSRVCF